MKNKPLLLIVTALCMVQAPLGKAELADQGLNSIMQIIDQAIEQAAAAAEQDDGEQAGSDALVNLSRTLGTLSYSRLQCGEAEVLAEFTARVQQVSQEQGDAMRNAFQEGFDKSKAETSLLSADECERLTRARTRNQASESVEAEETSASAAAANDSQQAVAEPEVVEEPEELSYLRVAELTGQLAYKRKFCQDDKVFNRDYNQYLNSVPEEYREAVKEAYWKGYKHGGRLNKFLTAEQCK